MDNKALFPNSATGADDQLSEQLADITAKVLRFTSAGGAAIALVSGNVAVTKASSGNLAPDVDSRLRLDGSFAGLCIQKAELLYCEDAETDTRVDSAASASLGIRSMVMVPVGEAGRVRGVLAAFSAMPNGFRPTHIAVMRTLADIVNELAMREEQSRPAPVVQMPVRPIERPVPAPTVANPEPPETETHVAPPLPPEVERSIEAATGRSQAASLTDPAAVVIERASEAGEPQSHIPPQAAPEPIKVSTPTPTVFKVEEPKPLVKDRFERPEPVAPPAPKSEPQKFDEPSKREKDPLPSIVALVNAQKKAEQATSQSTSDILIPAADPRLSSPAKSPTGGAPKVAPVSPKPGVREPKPLLTSTPVATPAIESPMFRSLEQPSGNSGLNMKIVAAIVVGVLLLGGAGWGIYSLMQGRQQTAVTAPLATEQAPQTSESVSQAPAITQSAQSTPEASTKTNTPASSANTSATRTKEEAADEETRQPERRPAVVVANNGAVPKRPSGEQVEAPTVAFTGRPEMGALLANNKAAPPKLSVQRSVLSPPEVIRRVPPKFPEIARRTNPAGDRVVLNVTVGGDGRVKNVNVVRGQKVFAEAATNAVKQWQYRPAFLNGEAVESTVEVVVSFTGVQ